MFKRMLIRWLFKDIINDMVKNWWAAVGDIDTTDEIDEKAYQEGMADAIGDCIAMIDEDAVPATPAQRYTIEFYEDNEDRYVRARSDLALSWSE